MTRPASAAPVPYEKFSSHAPDGSAQRYQNATAQVEGHADQGLAKLAASLVFWRPPVVMFRVIPSYSAIDLTATVVENVFDERSGAIRSTSGPGSAGGRQQHQFDVNYPVDITSAHWGLAGAEAVLKRRAPKANGSFEGHGAFTGSVAGAGTTNSGTPQVGVVGIRSSRLSRTRSVLQAVGLPATKPGVRQFLHKEIKRAMKAPKWKEVKTRRTVAVALHAVLVGTLAGCGSSQSSQPASPSPSLVPKADFIESLDGECAREQDEQASLGAPPALNPAHITAHDMPAVAAYLDKVIPALQGYLSRVRALGEPDEDRAIYDKARSEFQSALDAQVGADAAAHRGDPTAFQASFNAFRMLLKQSGQDILRFGARVCGTLGPSGRKPQSSAPTPT